MLMEQTNILLMSDTQTIKKIFNVSFRELLRSLKLCHVVLNVPVLFDGFNDVALAMEFQQFFGNHRMGITDLHSDA